ncbi:MAG: hypothetical protein D3919_04135 [Candidatus Electrothrix sp. AW5]|nr:hypothetical protein [Candidatus Electrothrix gigas]MCI5193608.1 hypothetical protein [Candidatus Electrothrix gigas]MCI5195414.1 hypothetical protein [Candidatus Electrothrix gigas]MCI5225142.1 hypothetical protein [Candidatus Electrothrix gigas]
MITEDGSNPLNQLISCLLCQIGKLRLYRGDYQVFIFNYTLEESMQGLVSGEFRCAARKFREG